MLVVFRRRPCWRATRNYFSRSNTTIRRRATAHARTKACNAARHLAEGAAAMNIVETISRSLGDDVYAKLGSLIGEDHDKAQAAASASIPALLAGLAHLGSTREGSVKLASAIDQADEHLTSRVGSLAGGEARSMLDRGRELLASLFGSSSLSGLGGALGKFTGMGSGSMMGFLGGLLPLILGGLKKIKGSMGLDSGGLSQLLSSQKENITAAMPQGLSGMLASVPGVGDVVGAARKYAGAAADTGRAAGRAVADAGRATAPAASSAMRWAVPLVLLLALGAWLLYKYANRTPEPAPPGPQANKAPAQVLPDARTAAAQIGSSMSGLTDQVTSWTKSATDAFSNIKDEASAQAALPSLRELNDKLDGVKTSLSAVPADAKKPILQTLSSSFTKLKELADKAMAMPGVGEKLRPVVEPMLNKLQALSGG
jgi:hypothetical protein